MTFIAWIVLGGLAGWLASIVTKRNDQMGCISNILAGIVGAFVGGWLGNTFFGYGITGFNLQSLIVATAGAIIVLALLNLLLGRK